MYEGESKMGGWTIAIGWCLGDYKESRVWVVSKWKEKSVLGERNINGNRVTENILFGCFVGKSSECDCKVLG